MHVSVGSLLALKFLNFLFFICINYNPNYNGTGLRIFTLPLGRTSDRNYIGNEGFLYFDPEHFSTIWRNSTKITITAKVKRSAAPNTLYSNSVLVFHPVIKLVHDIEVNPGPNKPTKESPTSSKNNNNIKIAHLNVRSLKNRGHFVQVKDIVASHNFDVFTISETWLDHTVSNLEIEIPGYDIYRIDRQNKRGGGVCAYVRQFFKTEVLNEISGISDNGLHQLWVKIQVRN